MKVARFSAHDQVSYGVVENDVVVRIDGHPFGPIEVSGDALPLRSVRLLAPVLPSKIMAIGRNYADHATEMGGAVPAEPLLFLKPSTSVVGPGDPIAYPSLPEQVDFEGELAVVIGRLCRDVPAERALDVVLGYTCANDVTARDLQSKDGQWSRAKGYDTFCPLGPWIETGLDPAATHVRTTVNGEVKQDADTSLIVHTVPTLIAHISAVMTLLPGDVILTGTPAGVGPLEPGDEVSVEIDGIGTLTNPVVRRG